MPGTALRVQIRQIPDRRLPVRIAAFLTALILPAAASAACPGKMILSCDVSQTRSLEVCLSDGAFHYRYGPKGRTDLALSAPLSSGPVEPWPGVGNNIWSKLIFRNGDYRYEVWTASSRTGDDPQSAGVAVLKGETPVTELTCLPGRTHTPAVLFEDVMTDEGWCVNSDQKTWRRC